VQWKRNQPPAATGLFARALGHEPGNPGYRKHLLMVLDGIDSADGPWAELKSLLSGDATAANVVRVAELLKMLEGAGDTK
jgi:hypothetical protein